MWERRVRVIFRHTWRWSGGEQVESGTHVDRMANGCCALLNPPRWIESSNSNQHTQYGIVLSCDVVMELTDTVGADKSQYLSGSRHGEAVQFEGVGAVAVSGVALKVLGKVDDLDGLERTLLHSSTHSPCTHRSAKGTRDGHMAWWRGRCYSG